MTDTVRAPGPIRICLETVPKRTFAIALDWPGWTRSGRNEPLSIEALLDAEDRYRAVAARAGLEIEPADRVEVVVVEQLAGGSGTEFGVPSAIAAADRSPVDAREAGRLAALVEAAWAVFDETAAAAPETLRKGPRGGGRDRTRIVAHVIEADAAYAREIGLRVRPPDPADAPWIAALRGAMLEVLRTPSDGSPLAGRRWPLRYAARRIAWHALDHAWEIEDRTER